MSMYLLMHDVLRVSTDYWQELANEKMVLQFCEEVYGESLGHVAKEG
jgi:hypothetical protein